MTDKHTPQTDREKWQAFNDGKLWLGVPSNADNYGKDFIVRPVVKVAVDGKITSKLLTFDNRIVESVSDIKENQDD